VLLGYSLFALKYIIRGECNNMENKFCPFIGRECMKELCELYNENVKVCMIKEIPAELDEICFNTREER
ncbi:MAG: hypothetical protein ACI4RN_08445, partial [Oscillospiraceae bacterium]